MTELLNWATVGSSQVTEPPEAKKTQGHNAGEPTAAEYMNWWMDRVGGKFVPKVLTDANQTLTAADLFRRLVQTPTANRVNTLPTTNVGAGATIELHNLATSQKFTIEASAGGDICQFQNGSMRLMALQDTPTLPIHWRILDVYGGANPSFFADKDASSQNISSTAPTLVSFVLTSGDTYDTNGNFASNAFIPTVPGKYEISLFVLVNNYNVDEELFLRLRKNGSDPGHGGVFVGNNSAATSPVVQVTSQVEANGVDDDFTVLTDSVADSNYDVSSSSWFAGHRIGD